RSSAGVTKLIRRKFGERTIRPSRGVDGACGVGRDAAGAVESRDLRVVARIGRRVGGGDVAVDASAEIPYIDLAGRIDGDTAGLTETGAIGLGEIPEMGAVRTVDIDPGQTGDVDVAISDAAGVVNRNLSRGWTIEAEPADGVGSQGGEIDGIA